MNLFSDYFAQKENCFSALDARLKTAFSVASVCYILISNSPLIPISICILLTGLLLMIKIPPKFIFLRLMPPLAMTATVTVLQMFIHGNHALFTLSVAGVSLTAYREGFSQGILLLSRTLGTVTIILFLSFTTTVNDILSALKWYHLPNAWIEISLFCYRFIFVFIDQIITFKDAQTLRLGYSRTGLAFQSLGTLLGSGMCKAFDQSRNTYQAMILRGHEDSC